MTEMVDTGSSNSAFLSPRKCYTGWSRCYFPHKRPPLKCVALQKFSKSQKMLYWVVKVLFSSQKTATKCVALQKFSKSQKQGTATTTQQQGKPITREATLLSCQLAFLAEASKNVGYFSYPNYFFSVYLALQLRKDERANGNFHT